MKINESYILPKDLYPFKKNDRIDITYSSGDKYALVNGEYDIKLEVIIDNCYKIGQYKLMEDYLYINKISFKKDEIVKVYKIEDGIASITKYRAKIPINNLHFVKKDLAYGLYKLNENHRGYKKDEIVYVNSFYLDGITARTKGGNTIDIDKLDCLDDILPLGKYKALKSISFMSIEILKDCIFEIVRYNNDNYIVKCQENDIVIPMEYLISEILYLSPAYKDIFDNEFLNNHNIDKSKEILEIKKDSGSFDINLYLNNVIEFSSDNKKTEFLKYINKTTKANAIYVYKDLDGNIQIQDKYFYIDKIIY